MRALLLLSLLVLLAAGAYLWHSWRFASAAEREIAPAGSQLFEREAVFEVGGGPPAAPPRAAAPAEGPGAIAEAETEPASEPPRPAPRDSRATEASKPGGSVSVTLPKGQTLYSLAVKHYGSGAPAIRRDIASASRIADETKIREGATIVLPAVAGGQKRRT